MAHHQQQPLPKREQPIFSKSKVNFIPNSPITHLCVSSNRITIAMLNKTILKIDPKDQEHPEEINLQKYDIDAKLSNMFLDPTGQHLILTFSPKDSLNPAEVMYIAPKDPKPKDVVALKGHIITAVAWNQDFESPFLLGTSKGAVFEGEILNGDVKNLKQVYDIGKGNSTVICGLEFFFLPRSTKCYIFIATSKRLYQFRGNIPYREERPMFTGIFNSYISQTSEETYKEFGQNSPTGNWTGQAGNKLSILHSSNLPYPRAIAYLSDSGLMVFNHVLSPPVTENGDEDFLSSMVPISYPKSSEDDYNASNPQSVCNLPRSLMVTDYHVLLLLKSSVKAVSILNEGLVYDDNYNEVQGRPLNIIKDPVRGTIWCYTERGVFRYAVNDEDRSVWKIFLDKADFVKSREYSKHDADKLEVIHLKQAEHCFANKEYEMSAMYYGMTKASFEEVALKFVQIDDSHALKTFLLKKMSTLKSTDLTKITVLVMWLIEIYLNELGSLRDFGKQSTAEYNTLREQFLVFMTQPLVKDCVVKNKKAVYDLMASHGDQENLVHFTLVMRDFDEVIENNIANGLYGVALSTLQKQKDAQLYSKYIPVLLDKDPKATIDALISGGRMHNPIKLLPKFSSKLDDDTAKQITRYLEHCVNSLRYVDLPIHDYLVSLYVYYYSEDSLMSYLEGQGTDVNRVRYDPKYALMLCLEKKLNYASIHLYTILCLYEEAVSLAIQVDLELAKSTASKPEDDVETRKKLWLKIAKHVVKEKNDIKQAMEFLKQCDLVKIEDILPFFPNFVTIEHFKEAICQSLQEYNQHIQTLKREMDEATKSAEVIRDEIHAVRNRCAVIRATDQCTLCENTLLIRNFYVFPCGHKFHADCLMSEIFPTLSQPRKKLLNELQKKLGEITLNQEALSTSSTGISSRDQLKSSIDDIIASECVYCGDNMIKLIDIPFIPQGDYEKVQKEWE
ncbi:unnamed protein product [Orchesella dallaii]|uniref:Vacuolar protein sorting-associated protein 18 homolog n=1 Tax=Orchesella dallaii TaxID=48710 RepID=A0ABP1QJN9_9HEXA